MRTVNAKRVSEHSLRTSVWQDMERAQGPEWPDPGEVRRVCGKLRQFPALVRSDDIDLLLERLGRVSEGDGFILQGGACAETFQQNTYSQIAGLASLLAEMALTIGGGSDIITIARLAGQFAKPRSTYRDASGLINYRGDMVNDRKAHPRSRTPDPNRMVLAYAHAAAALRWLPSLTGAIIPFCSHEALILEYEQSLTRTLGRRHLDLSAHFLWIGERTRQLGGAHVAYATTIANPLGVKLGPTASPLDILKLCRVLNPHNQPGRLTLILRLGVHHIASKLPAIVESVQNARQAVIWMCDPMHGNMRETSTGRRTRHYDDILKELTEFVSILRRHGVHPGGVHLEIAPKWVTECLGGVTCPLILRDLPRRYTSAMDPRLNCDQARDLAAATARLLRPDEYPLTARDARRGLK